jgi:coenzyme F420-reducing hydrogenase gamma subunit
VECKRKGHSCVLVAKGQSCLGPVTHAGCGALCPGYDRGCYGCYGPKENANTSSLSDFLQAQGESQDNLRRLFRSFNAGAEPFARESRRHE